MTTPRITVLFHDSPSVATFLSSAAGRGFAGDLLVECSFQPSLGFVLNLETPANYPGVAGLLGGADVGTLAHPSDHLPAPIVLAPGTPVARSAFRAALGRLHRPDERLSAITLLVPISDAITLGGALAVADRFLIAWDVSHAPHEELVAFARWLAAERLGDEDNFDGLFPYAVDKLDPAHAQRLQSILMPIATRSPSIRSTIVNTAR
jgi:hypothetical protein